jgi:hypothetical protein
MESSKAGSRKTASNLSESIHQHLNMYAIAAGAAGVGVLALAQPAEAKIVYTPANVRISDDAYGIDLNQDGVSDVVISQGCFHTFYGLLKCRLFADLAQGNGIEEEGGGGYAAALKAGANIGQTKQFNFSSHVLMASGRPLGHWWHTQARYLGVEFQISGKTHFGWARFRDSSDKGATLTGYAYETIPGKSIIAGRTKGRADEYGEEDFGPGASLSSPIPDKPQPASLGMLALGAHGVPLWRRKESALEGDLKGALL